MYGMSTMLAPVRGLPWLAQGSHAGSAAVSSDARESERVAEDSS